MADMAGRNGAAARLRARLLLLVVVGVVGTCLALAYERHWLSPWQLAPWITVGIVGVAAVALVVRQIPVTVRLARAVAAIAMVSALLGTWQHIDANLNPDPMADQHADRRHNATTSAQDSEHSEESDGDGHHHDDEKSSASHDQDPADEDASSPSPSFADVVIGAVGHAPVPAALSLAPIGLALGLATIGLGGSRSASKE